ncbi:A/G-specific adenine glycosylase [Breoghania sp. L-A4]|uniref:A/G-specific adenine glycosylase n=1 Tax=Breoghania sp. L-A4 TaxID=2304600 RepID=UPI000E35879A|nr:A/G-specific adenine glycosylase [Breoghania sp. L-A4]AXS39521.1 A/G-specific adenine glycosylase [Breoghania sp. L-A4]
MDARIPTTSRPEPAPQARDLLAWYDRHARALPWRVPPQERAHGVVADPYRIWLSEIMLQQTTVAAVKSYFEKFVGLWPTVADLAAVGEEDVMKAWAGLGYYSRARNLKKCADAVVARHDGRFPETEAALQDLPGIGAYTSAAIATIAFDQPAIVVDGNVERVISRLFEVETPLPAAKPEIKALTATIAPRERPGDFAQAMMDLGATICTPKRPACSLCPWNDACAAFAAGTAETFPRKMPKKQKPTRSGAAFVAVRADGAVLLRRRPPEGLLGGMSEVPGTPWAEDFAAPEAAAHAPLDARWALRTGPVKHTFTHFHLLLDVYHAELPHAVPAPDGHWWSARDDLDGEALPTVMRKAVAAGLGKTLKAR